MPFETSLSPYVNNNSCYSAASPALAVKDYNGDGSGEIVHPKNADDIGEDTKNILDVDDNSNNEGETKFSGDDKFLILSRNLYHEGNGCNSMTAGPQYPAYSSEKLFNPYQARIPNLSMPPYSSQLREECLRPAKSPAFEPSDYASYREDKPKIPVCDDEDQKMFASEETNDACIQKPIYPWMVDSRHNTKSRQQQMYDREKEQFNQFMGEKNI